MNVPAFPEMRRHLVAPRQFGIKLLCNGCDTERSFPTCYCPTCDEVTDSYEFDGVDVYADAKAILKASPIPTVKDGYGEYRGAVK